jgi:hypothetical protein
MLQPNWVIVFTQKASVFLIRYAFSHDIAYSGGTDSINLFLDFVFTMNTPLKNRNRRYPFPDAGTKLFKRILAAPSIISPASTL